MDLLQILQEEDEEEHYAVIVKYVYTTYTAEIIKLYKVCHYMALIQIRIELLQLFLQSYMCW